MRRSCAIRATIDLRQADWCTLVLLSDPALRLRCCTQGALLQNPRSGAVSLRLQSGFVLARRRWEASARI